MTADTNLSDIAIGDRIGGYRVVGLVTGGGYLAAHPSRAQRVLIEIGSRIDLARTAQVIESLQHPGVARMIARGELADKRPWIASEVVDGVPLYDVIATRVMATDDLVRLIRNIAGVLTHAHRLGVVHHSLTLRSVTLLTGARVYPVAISDWGVRAERGVYTAPERKGDGRADVYALGVIAYRAATRLFPRGVVTHVDCGSPGLSTLISRMIASDPDERPTAAEVVALAAELRATVDGDVVASALEEAADLATEEPELMPFAEDDDRAHITAPRFAKPRWTPAPKFSITDARNDEVTGEIVAKRPSSD
jgi:serine/threonine protein kinase